MRKHIRRVLKIKGHKMFLACREVENVSIMITKARAKRFIDNHETLYKIREVNTDFNTNQSVITWSNK